MRRLWGNFWNKCKVPPVCDSSRVTQRVGWKHKTEECVSILLYGMIVTIPGNKELKIGLLKNAIRKAGLTEEGFLKFL